MNIFQAQYNQLGEEIQRLYRERDKAIRNGQIMPWDENEEFVALVHRKATEKKELEDSLRRSVCEETIAGFSISSVVR